MNRRLSSGSLAGLLIFSAISLRAAHPASDHSLAWQISAGRQKWFVQRKSLCYNAANMEHLLRFVNNNNNDNDNNPLIVGRSLAG
jgi:hypothetical protein